MKLSSCHRNGMQQEPQLQLDEVTSAKFQAELKRNGSSTVLYTPPTYGASTCNIVKWTIINVSRQFPGVAVFHCFSVVCHRTRIFSGLTITAEGRVHHAGSAMYVPRGSKVHNDQQRCHNIGRTLER